MPRGCVRTSARLVTKYICNTGVHASKVDVQVIIAFLTRLNYCLKTLKSNLTQRLLGLIAMKNAKRIGRHDLNTQINKLYTTKKHFKYCRHFQLPLTWALETSARNVVWRADRWSCLACCCSSPVWTHRPTMLENSNNVVFQRCNMSKNTPAEWCWFLAPYCICFYL